MAKGHNPFIHINRLSGLLFCWAFLLLSHAHAQNGIWTWMKGSATPNQTGNYGIQGIPSPNNTPPGLYEAVEWTDVNGNFWIFGGSFGGGLSISSTLWKYDIILNEWVWMKGPSLLNAPGVYGTKGVPSPLNYPGARSYGAVSWTGLNNDLWLFGGFGYGSTNGFGNLSDLWKYDLSTNEWTWMSGVDTAGGSASYGTLQVPLASNQPPIHNEGVSAWVDNAGNLWKFAGGGRLLSSDDMWMYNTSTNVWTWMSGQSIGIVPPNYGTIGIPSPTNTPGSRWSFARWKDLSGNFWLFGGLLVDTFGVNIMSDMWMYDPVTNVWTWMAGVSTPNTNSTFTQQCVAGNDIPPALSWENRACWTDLCGRFWSFGGFDAGFDAYNTLWMFDPTTLQFTWVHGSITSNSPGNFGTQTIPSATNQPPALLGGNAFQKSNGELWLFGGFNNSFNEYNTLWRYQIDPNCPGGSASAAFSVQPANIGCAPYTVQFTPPFTTYTTYHWDFGDPSTLTDTSTSLSPSWIYTQAGTYTATLAVSETLPCGILKYDTATFTITAVLSSPTFDLGPDTTFCEGQSVQLATTWQGKYQWNTGDTTASIIADSSGIYILDLTINNCATVKDSVTIVVNPTPVFDLGPPDTTLCSGQSILLNPGVPGTYNWSTGDTSSSIVVSSVGWYTLQVTLSNCSATDFLIVTSIDLLPNISLGTDTTLCGASSFLTLNAGNPGMNYLWSTGDTTQTILVQGGTHSVQVFNSNNMNCTDQDSIVVQQIFLDPDLGSDTNICSGQSLTISPGLFNSYSWNTGDTSSSIVINSTGVYIVQVSASNCFDTDTIDIVVDSLPIVNLGADTNLCDTALTIALDAGNSGMNYLWSTGDTSQTISAGAGVYRVDIVNPNNINCFSYDSIVISIKQLQPDLGNDTGFCSGKNMVLNAGIFDTYLWSTGDTTESIIVSNSGIYSVTVTSSTCSASDTFSLVVYPSPMPNLGPDTGICFGQFITLNPGSFSSYVWNTGDTTATLLVSAGGIYSVDVDSGLCSSSDTIAIAINPFPVVNLGVDTMLCPNTMLVLDATNPGALINWNTGDTTSFITVVSPGTYHVLVNANNCIVEDSIAVAYSESIRLGPDTSLCTLLTGIRLDAGNPGADYLWSTGESTQTILAEQPGWYWVTMNNEGCLLTDSIFISGELGGGVLYTPNAFTPNTDGLNEKFVPQGEGISNFNMLIFNRWGEKIFETNDFNSGWDGRVKNELVPEGVYIYVINYQSACTQGKRLRKIGHVMVLR